MLPAISHAYSRPFIKESREVNYTRAAQKLMISSDYDTYLEALKEVAAELKDLKTDLRKHPLPYNLTAFHIACMTSDIDLLHKALDHDTSETEILKKTDTIPVDELSVSISDTYKIPPMNGDTPLHCALFQNFHQANSFLITILEVRDKLENTVNGTGNSLLNLAARNCDLETVKKLCKLFNRNPKYKNYLFHETHQQSTLLHHAAYQQSPDVFDYILAEQQKFNANTLHVKDKGGNTPLMIINTKITNNPISPDKHKWIEILRQYATNN